MAGKPERFLTLTTWPQPGETAQDVYKKYRPKVSYLFAKLRKMYGSFEAVTILERTQKGFPHWHCLVRCPFIPQQVISDLWQRLTGAKIVDIRRIRDEKEAICYVTKYILKAVDNNLTHRLGRLTSFTSGYSIQDRVTPQTREFVWSKSRLCAEDELKVWYEGWRAVRTDSGWDLYPETDKAYEREEHARRARLNDWLHKRAENKESQPPPIKDPAA